MWHSFEIRLSAIWMRKSPLLGVIVHCLWKWILTRGGWWVAKVGLVLCVYVMCSLPFNSADDFHSGSTNFNRKQTQLKFVIRKHTLEWEWFITIIVRGSIVSLVHKRSLWMDGWMTVCGRTIGQLKGQLRVWVLISNHKVVEICKGPLNPLLNPKEGLSNFPLYDQGLTQMRQCVCVCVVEGWLFLDIQKKEIGKDVWEMDQ